MLMVDVDGECSNVGVSYMLMIMLMIMIWEDTKNTQQQRNARLAVSGPEKILRSLVWNGVPDVGCRMRKG